MVDLMSALAIPSIFEGEGEGEQEIELIPKMKQRRRKLFKNKAKKGIPLGLNRCSPHDWVNALMQLLIYLPDTPHLFSFVPRSFEVIREFIEQYLIDQQEKLTISTADGVQIAKCLIKNLPKDLFRDPNRVDLYEIVQLLIRSIYPYFDRIVNNFLLFHPEWHLIWDVNEELSLEKALLEKAESSPSEILVAVRGWEYHNRRMLKRQLFSPNLKQCYDLDAFIEHRQDVRNSAQYIAYLKVEGVWYQCDDDRVTPLLSTTLSVPLHRSVLLHYRKIALFH